MKIAVIGCGYVFDLYMTTMPHHLSLELVGIFDTDPARAEAVARIYGLHVYPDRETLLADPRVECVVNLTPIGAHFEVSRAALTAGKHVYSEKPLTKTLAEAEALADLAAETGLRLSCAPSNALSATVRTLGAIVAGGHLGAVRLVYAEFDDNPVYLLEPETWRSRSGAPWPYLHEYEMGCTWEHAGYHLSWMCALFGPVSRLTAHASRILPDKTDLPLDPPDTPDFSVAVLTFESGVIGRLTCSIAAPSDHRMRIIGNRGMAEADTYRNYDAPVRLWPFDAQSLKAQRARAVRRHPWVAALVGSGGRRVPLSPPAHPPKPAPGPGLSPKRWLSRLRSNQLGAQDKSAGLAELAAALAEDRPHFPPTDFTLHVTELTHAIQAAGPGGASHEMTTRFAPLPDQMAPPSRPDLARYARPAAVPRLVGRLVGRRAGH